MPSLPNRKETPAPSSRQLRQQRRRTRELFKRGQQAESYYARQLRAIAKQVGTIVRGFAPDGIVESMQLLRQSLEKYAELIQPWAKAVGARMVNEVARKDASAWAAHGKLMGRALHREIMNAPTGDIMREMLNEQVDLITSIPRKAAERVHELTLRGMQNATRADEIAEDIRRTTHVTESRAKTIARTEVTRTATALLQSRAQFVGAESYVWRSSLDSDVRPLHRKLNGKTFRWDDPPITGENGERSAPGAIYNCRCWPDPIIPDVN